VRFLPEDFVFIIHIWFILYSTTWLSWRGFSCDSRL